MFALVGKRFGKLLVMRFDHVDSSSNSCWECKCDCGKTSVVNTQNLKNATRSCGCLIGTTGNKKGKKNPKYRHGMSYKRIYRIWAGMLTRCGNPKSISFKNYGAKGISICLEWRNAKTFLEWAFSHGYKNNLTIDRIDNKKGYNPNNCRWIANSENIAKSNRERKK